VSFTLDPEVADVLAPFAPRPTARTRLPGTLPRAAARNLAEDLRALGEAEALGREAPISGGPRRPR
jgi:hypothetical protein